MSRLKHVLLTCCTVLFLQACNDDDNTPTQVTPTPEPPAETPTTIVDVAVSDGNFTTLVAALQATGLDQTLADSTSTFTVFAPTDAAFAKLGQDTIDALLADTDTLSSILTYHVVSGSVDAEAAIAAAGTKVTTVNMADIGLSLVDGTLFVNNAAVTATDVAADNGLIHVIDTVILPPAEATAPTSNIVETAVAAGSFNSLVAALQATELDATLADETQSFTVFAPTDDAFAMIGEDTLNTLLANPDVLSSILLQHVVPGSVDAVTAYTLNGMNATTASGAMIPVALNSAESRQLTFGGANVTMTDIMTTNGIIHVIDTVVVADVAIPTAAQSIVDVAAGAGSFNTLVAALQATGLDTVLANTGEQFTVFAPTDAAFALLGEETITALLNDTDTLSNILLYHVISGATILQDGAVSVAQSDSSLVTMANMQQSALSLSGSMLYVNASKVSMADIMADNGVIHVVDQVILPPAARGEPTMTIAEVASSNADFETLTAALTAAGLVDTLADANANFTVFAPTDAAFDKIEDSTLSALLADTTSLTNVLLQHVVSGEIPSLNSYAANGANVNTLANNDVTVALVNNTEAANDDTTEVAYDAMNQRLVGGMGSSNPGLTLYVFDNDLGTAGSVCNDSCAEAWPPVLVTDGNVSSLAGLSTVTRDDGSLQAAYQGRPLYFFVNDTMAGETNGQGVNNVWWQVDQPQVALQIQGSNVITTDIYTTNGVIHVIDSVITETLSSD